MRQALTQYYKAEQAIPDTLHAANVPPAQARALTYDNDDMSLTARTAVGVMVMYPQVAEAGLVWHCAADDKAKRYLPASCRED